MKMCKKMSVVVMLVFVAALSTAPLAQGKQEAEPVSPQKTNGPKEPSLTDDDRRVIASLQVDSAAFAKAIAVLQEKLDAITGAWNRFIQSRQVDGYDLNLQSPTGYVKRKPEK